MAESSSIRQASYALIPSVDQLLQAPEAATLMAEFGRHKLTQAVRLRLQELREQIGVAEQEQGKKLLAWLQQENCTPQLLVEIGTTLTTQLKSSLTPVINLTGTVLHTNLGRACLPENAVAAMSAVAAQASNVEYDVPTGKRGDRDSHIEALLCELTGAEAVTVVNNNAAAVLLVLNTLALGREVPISRGELVEIGGAFRIPEVMKSAGCKLVEIGTTNRTHVKDYSNASHGGTALLLKVHTSNYAIQGFTNSVANKDLARLAQDLQLPLVHDLGSGTLIDMAALGLPPEPTVTEVLAEGADIVTFSGDKLLGGPQAGIIAGKRELIEKIKRNPLKRALRLDKIILTALLHTLLLYRDPDRLSQRLPLLRHLTRTTANIEALAKMLLLPMQECLKGVATVSVTSARSQIGSGSLPLELLDSAALKLTPIAEKGKSDASLNALASAFRNLPKPVIGRVHDGSLLFDLRCLENSEEFLSLLDHLQVDKRVATAPT